MGDRFLILSSTIVTAAISTAALAQSPSPVSWTASVIPASIARGGSSQIQIEASIDPGWHIYSVTQPQGGPMATRIALLEDSPLRSSGSLRQGKFEKRNDVVFHMDVESFADRATFTLPVQAADSAKPGEYVARVEITYQACSARTCLLPAHPVVSAKFSISDAARTVPSAIPEPTKTSSAANAKSSQGCPSSSASLRRVYDQARVLQHEDPDAYRRQLECIPALLKSHGKHRGDDLYYAGVMLMRYDSYFHKDGNAAKAADDLDRFLKTQTLSPHEESALANLVVAEATAGRFDDAVQRFEQLLKKYRRRSTTHETWADTTNVEHAGMSLVRSLTDARRSADVEKVSRELMRYMEERDSEAAWRAASVSSSLFESLEDQDKADAAVAARSELAEHFAVRDKYPASAEMWLATRRIAALERTGKPAEALALLEQNKNNYAKAGFARIYENDVIRLSLYDHPAPPLQAEEWINSEPLSLDTLRGKVVVLDFWASWCLPCREGFPALHELSRRRGPEGLVIIGVTQNDGWILTRDGRTIGRGTDSTKLKWPDEVELLKQFIGDFKLTMPIAVGRRPVDSKTPFANAAIVQNYGVNSFPKGIVIDRSGVVKFVGNPEDSRYMQAIDSALASSPQSSQLSQRKNRS